MTTLTLLSTKKRILDRQKCGRAFIYRPRVSREEVSRSMISDLRDVLFGKQLPSLVLNLLSEEPVSESDLASLRAALEKLEANK